VKSEKAQFVFDIIFVCCIICWNKSAYLVCGLVVAEVTLGCQCRMSST